MSARIIITPSAPLKVAAVFAEKREHRIIRYQANYYTWTGTRYQKLDEEEARGEIWRFLAAAVTRHKVETPGDEDGPAKYESVPVTPTTKLVSSVLDALRSVVLVPSAIQVPAWLPNTAGGNEERPADLFACGNCIVNLLTGEPRRHTSDFLTMNAVDYEFDPESAAPGWQQCLDDWFPGSLAYPTKEQRAAQTPAQRDAQQRRETLQEQLGYLLTCDVAQQKLFAWIGEKRSGKGTCAAILRALLGRGNWAGPTLKGLGAEFGLEDLIDKKAAIISDARLDGRQDIHEIVSRLLMLSGGDGITINRKGEKKWSGQPFVRVVILTNPLLNFTDASAVIASRFILVQFKESFLDREDTGLLDKLLPELPGIFNWAMVGLRRLRARGHFVQPDSSVALVERMADRAAPIRRFEKECLIRDPKLSTAEDAVYRAYKAWCENGGFKPGSKATLESNLCDAHQGTELRRPIEGGRRVWRYYGIGLTSAEKAAEKELSAYDEALRSGRIVPLLQNQA
jgi:putative DNA primase/helicase